MSTKISVTIEDSTLAWLRRRAKLVHAGNLSAAISEAALVARKQEALGAFLEEAGVSRLAPSELAEIVAEWAPVTKRSRQTRRRTATAKR